MTDANGSACSQAPQALLDEWIANARRAALLPHVAAKAQRVKKGATPSEVVFEEDRVNLLHYPGDGNIKHRTPLIFVFALVNRPYILDILPNKSVVSHFVKAGFDTYLDRLGRSHRRRPAPHAGRLHQQLSTLRRQARPPP